MEKRKFRVTERFSVDLISEVDAVDEKDAEYLHRQRIAKLHDEQYANEVAFGTSIASVKYEIEQID